MDQLVVIKQIRKQPVGVIPADCAQDHVDFRISESFEQIGSPVFRMLFQVPDSFQCVGHETDVNAI